MILNALEVNPPPTATASTSATGSTSPTTARHRRIMTRQPGVYNVGGHNNSQHPRRRKICDP